MLKKILENETYQSIHRMINTFIMVFVVVIGFQTITPLYDKLSGIESNKIIESEIAQIAEDEGYRKCVYKDSLGLRTIGFGILLKENDSNICIDGHRSIELLREHYTIATKSVEKRYPWADGESKLLLINLSYNMGATRLSKFKRMLYHLERKDYDLSAGELLNSRYATQTSNRAGRIASRIMAINGE